MYYNRECTSRFVLPQKENDINYRGTLLFVEKDPRFLVTTLKNTVRVR